MNTAIGRNARFSSQVLLNKKGVGMSKAIHAYPRLLSIIWLFVLPVGFIACGLLAPDRHELPTGVAKMEHPDGTIELIATARASPNAISRNLPVMMRATSHEGARLILKHELLKSRFNSAKFKKIKTEFLRRGEYCRIRGIYYPEGLPEKEPNTARETK